VKFLAFNSLFCWRKKYPNTGRLTIKDGVTLQTFTAMWRSDVPVRMALSGVLAKWTTRRTVGGHRVPRVASSLVLCTLKCFFLSRLVTRIKECKCIVNEKGDWNLESIMEWKWKKGSVALSGGALLRNKNLLNNLLQLTIIYSKLSTCYPKKVDLWLNWMKPSESLVEV